MKTDNTKRTVKTELKNTAFTISLDTISMLHQYALEYHRNNKSAAVEHLIRKGILAEQREKDEK